MIVNVKRSIVWSIGLALVASGVSPIAQGGQTAAPQAGQAATPPAVAQPAAPPSPVQIANQAERQRIMNLLKISAIPPGAVSSSPATYNEAEANPYPNLPDPLLLKNGQKVTTAAVWRSRRRARTPRGLPARNLRAHAEDAQGHVVSREHGQQHGRRDSGRDQAAPRQSRQLGVSGDQRRDPGHAQYAGERSRGRAGHHPVWRRRVPARRRRDSPAEPLRTARRLRRARGAWRTRWWSRWSRSSRTRPRAWCAGRADLAAAGAHERVGLRQPEHRQRAGRLRRRPDVWHHRPGQQGPATRPRRLGCALGVGMGREPPARLLRDRQVRRCQTSRCAGSLAIGQGRTRRDGLRRALRDWLHQLVRSRAAPSSIGASTARRSRTSRTPSTIGWPATI